MFVTFIIIRIITKLLTLSRYSCLYLGSQIHEFLEITFWPFECCNSKSPAGSSHIVKLHNPIWKLLRVAVYLLKNNSEKNVLKRIAQKQDEWSLELKLWTWSLFSRNPQKSTKHTISAVSFLCGNPSWEKLSIFYVGWLPLSANNLKGGIFIWLLFLKLYVHLHFHHSFK